MNADIQSLANELIYHGKLKVGSPAIAAQRLVLPKEEGDVPPLLDHGLCLSGSEGCWLEEVMLPEWVNPSCLFHCLN